ncbi:MAG: exodeoxyribonuclease V subunit gamma [Thiotrichaceae bacterium]|nr:exodeoxyribonuclease V subunit gamma [Thiotrichaceae bacterium]
MLHLHSSNRLEKLVDMLAEVTKQPLPTPFHVERIVVQSKGMERWLSLELAQRLGIWANAKFPFPKSIVWQILRTVLSQETDVNYFDKQTQHHFDPEVLQWGVMQILPTLLDDTDFSEIKHYLQDDNQGVKLFQLSQRVADLLDQYVIYRPEWIQAWEQDKILQELLSSGKSTAWQTKLWQALVEKYGNEHYAYLYEKFKTQVLQTNLYNSFLPKRLSIFGIHALPPFYIDIFEKLSLVTEVHFFILNPCQEYWGDILSNTEIAHRIARRYKKPNTPESLYFETGNRLLASWGQVGRDFVDMLLNYDADDGDDVIIDEPPKNLLEHLQADILHLAEYQGNAEQRVKLSTDDTSIQIHACHSPMREVDVLHDQLLALFERDPSLSPKDILVMMPDVESYAPFIQAVFDTQTDARKHIPFSIADRNLRSASALIDAFIALLELQHSRFNVNEVLNLLEREVVYRHFDLLPNDLSLIRRWLKETQVRWGIDAAHRNTLNLPAFEENTWRAGLQRLLLGYALPQQGTTLYQGILPFDEVEGSNSLVLGRFISFVEELFHYVEAFQTPRTLPEWNDFTQELLEHFFVNQDETESQAQAILSELNDLLNNSQAAGFTETVSSNVVVQHLQQRLAGEPLPTHFLTGSVTFCAMLPMRSIPFKVICLLGMNDQDYPRPQKHAGFDLIAEHPKRGDRSRRNSDCYLFLEALLSARQHFYLSYVGHSIHEEANFPPSVLISELQDYIRKGFQFADINEDTVAHLSTHHPLQPFSPRYFDQQQPRLFSYSEEYCAASQQMQQLRDGTWKFITTALPEPAEETHNTLDIQRLVRFFRNPSEYFLKERLGLRLPEQEDILKENEPFHVEAGLDEYFLNQQIVNYALSESDLAGLQPALKAAGQLPHGNMGELVYQKLVDKARPFVEHVKQELANPALPPAKLLINLGNREISGNFPKLWQKGYIFYRYKNLKAGDYLATWLHHLLLNAAAEQNNLLPRHSLMIGAKDGKVETCTLLPVDNSVQKLNDLVALYEQGLRQALHFFPKTAFSFIESLQKKPDELDKAEKAARATWFGSDHFAGEGENPFYQICFGRIEEFNPLDKLEFQALATQIFEPLLACRERS